MEQIKAKIKINGIWKNNPDYQKPYMKKYYRAYYIRNKKKILRRTKNYRRSHKLKLSIYRRENWLKLDGKWVKVKKRPFSGYCELCGKIIPKKPEWHHWNDEHLEIGIWVHKFPCHYLCEMIEQMPKFLEFSKRYLELKGELEARGELQGATRKP